MPTLFVSYPREYRAIVERLVGNLRSSGYDPFFDEQLAGGQSWWDELLTRIEHADVFMPVIGTVYLQSTPCHLEAQYATAWNKRILPVMIEPVPSQLFIPGIATAHWVDYTPQRENAILDVIRAINLLPPPASPPTPAPERPKTPISYMTELQNEVQGPAEISRERQLVLIADLKGRLTTGDRDAALMLLTSLRARPDLFYQSATDIDELLAAAGVPRLGRSGAMSAGGAASADTFDLSSVETVVVPGNTIGRAAATAGQSGYQQNAGQPGYQQNAGQPAYQQSGYQPIQSTGTGTAASPAAAVPGGWPGQGPTAAAEPAGGYPAYYPAGQVGSATHQAGPWPAAPPVPYPTAPAGTGRPGSTIPLAVVATLLFFPLGIAALIIGAKVNPAWDSGDHAGSIAAAKQAKGWAIAGIIVGGIVIVYLIGTGAFQTS